MHRSASLLLALALAPALACRQPPPADHDQVGHAPAGADAQVDSAHGAGGEALPLRPIMLALGESVAGFHQALWLEDYDRMALHAREIADHAHISPEETQRVRDELGGEMVRFEEADVAVHDAAVRLHAAIEARDMDAILQHFGEMQAGCVSCHTSFRERLRTDTMRIG